VALDRHRNLKKEFWAELTAINRAVKCYLTCSFFLFCFFRAEICSHSKDKLNEKSTLFNLKEST